MLFFGDPTCPYTALLAMRIEAMNKPADWVGLEVDPQRPLEGIALPDKRLAMLRQETQTVNTFREHGEPLFRLPEFLPSSKLPLLAILATEGRLTVPLCEAFWLDGDNIGDRQVLERIAHHLKLDLPEDFAETFQEHLDRDRLYAQEVGVLSIPSLVFLDDDQRITGLIPSASLRYALARRTNRPEPRV